MAWTTPRTWVVGEIVTAALMNTHVRDNLAYLKGDAGTIAFAAGATFAGAVAVTGAITATTTIAATSTITAGGALRSQSTAPGVWLDETDGGVKGAYLVLDGGALLMQRRATAYGAFEATVISLDVTAPASSIVLDSAGNLGLGRATPQGVIHTYDTISGCIKFEADAVAGSLIPVIPNGAGDAVYGIMGLYAVRASGGVTRGGNFTGAAATLLTPGSNQDLYNVGPGTDVLQIQVAADGSVGVIRTAGTLTYKVSLWLHWL